MTTRRRLGRTDLEISAIGLGCWQFSEGHGLVGGFWEALPQPTVNDIVSVSLAGGINWFDTAEAYGKGRSEHALSAALTAAGERPGDVLVATKWMPIPRTAASIGATPSMVALAWLVQFHGDTVVAIPGATRTPQAEENCGAIQLTLSAEELRRLDEVSVAVVR